MLEDIKNLTDADVDDFIAKHDGIIIFHKTLCPHCKVMGKVLLKVKELNTSVNVASIDSETDAALLEKFGVTRVPTLMIIKNGEKKALYAGVMKPQELVDFYASTEEQA